MVEPKVPLFGEHGDDTLRGDDGDDFISGGSGNDDVSGGFGKNLLCGDGDDDILDGSQGVGGKLNGGRGRKRCFIGAAQGVNDCRF